MPEIKRFFLLMSSLMAKVIKDFHFFVGTFPLDYDYMCSETDFTPEKKSFSSNHNNSQFFLFLLAATVSQNGQIAV